MHRAAMVAVHHPGGFILAGPARHRSSPLIAEQVPEGQPAQDAPKVEPYAWVIVGVLAITLTIASGARFLFGQA